MKNLTILLLALLSSSYLYAQDYPVDQGASIATADISFSAASGELYENGSGDSYNIFETELGYDYFVIPNLAIGGALGVSFEGQGDASSTAFQIGPSITYFIGNAESPVYPFVGIGFYYVTNNIDLGSDDITFNGTDIALGAGVLVPVKDHIGLTFSLSYDITKLTESESDESFDGNIFSIGFGIAGLFYNK